MTRTTKIVRLCAMVALSAISVRSQEPRERRHDDADPELTHRLLAYLDRTVSAPVVHIRAIDPPDGSGLRRVLVSLGDVPDAQTDTYYLTTDGKELVHGAVESVTFDPWRTQREGLNAKLQDAPSQGSSTAPVVLVEFSDLQCPYCGQLSREIEKIVGEMPETLKVAYEHFPMSEIHPWAHSAAAAAACVAKQGNITFWTFEQAVFKDQQDIKDDTAVARLRTMAVNAGADGSRYDACIGSSDPKRIVDNAISIGKGLGVSAVPTTFLNGRMIVGAISAETLRAMILTEASLVRERNHQGQEGVK